MAEFLPRHKQRLAKRRHEVDEIAFSNESVPPLDSEAVREFAAELSQEHAVRVPLRDDDAGLYGWPADGVREKIRTHGGSIRFGWRLHEWPGVLLTAEFHAVWVDPDGAFVDITPSAVFDEASAFVPDASYADTFEFDRHPPTRYMVLRVAPDRSAEVATRIAQMKPSQRAYEERRATKAGKTLEDWLLGKFPADPFVGPIAAFVDACQAFEAKLPRLPGLIQTDPHTIANEIIAQARLDAAGAVGTADAAAEAALDDARDQAVSSAPEQEVSSAPEQEASSRPEQEIIGGQEQKIIGGPDPEAAAGADREVFGGADQAVSGEHQQSADATTTDTAGNIPDGTAVDAVPSGAANADAPDNAADATAEAADHAAGDIAISDDLDGEFEETWLPEYETAVAEDELFGWANDRFNSRRAIMRLMLAT